MTERINSSLVERVVFLFVLVPSLALSAAQVLANLKAQERAKVTPTRYVAHSPQSQTHATRRPIVKVGNFEREIPDLVVTDQNGKRVRFYSDLIKNKVVVLGFFYTRCSYVCDSQGRNFAALQSQLGKRLGKEVFLISVTRTPSADQPANLKAWARKYGVQKGWTLITGEPADIAKLVGTFAHDNPGPQEMHSAPLLIGNDATGVWLTSSGLLAPEELAELINKVAASEVREQ